MSVFYEKKIDNEELEIILSPDKFKPQYTSECNNHKPTGLKIDISGTNIGTDNLFLTITSDKLNSTIYKGLFLPIVILNGDQKLFGKGMFRDDGEDILYFSFVDLNNMISYSCEQETGEIIWKPGKIAIINFFSDYTFSKIDGYPRCYSVTFDDIIK